MNPEDIELKVDSETVEGARLLAIQEGKLAQLLFVSIKAAQNAEEKELEKALIKLQGLCDKKFEAIMEIAKIYEQIIQSENKTVVSLDDYR